MKNKIKRRNLSKEDNLKQAFNASRRVVNSPTSQHRLALPVEIGTIENSEDGLTTVNIKGYTGASVNLSDYGIDHPVVYVTNGIQYKNKVPYLYGHYDPIGHAVDVTITNHQLSAKGIHSDPGERSKRVAGGIAKGMPYQASMGLDIDEGSIDFHEEGTVVVNGKTFAAPIYVVNKSELVELSAVLFGRDGDTEITPLSKETLMLIKNAKGGMRVNNATPEGKEEQATVPPVPPVPVVQNTAPATTTTTLPEKPAVTAPIQNSLSSLDIAELMADFPSHHKVVINELKKGHGRAEIENAIKLEKLENSHMHLPTGSHRPDMSVENAFGAQMALSMNVSPEFLASKLGKPAVDFANSQGPMGLREMLMYIANAEGGRFNGHSDVENMCAFLKRHVQNMEWSTINFPNWMNRISDWSMEEAWELEAPWTPGKIHETSLSNYQKAGRLRPGGGSIWDGLDPDGKIQHGTFGEEVTHEVSIDDVAQIVTFKHQMIQNDDMGMINEILRQMVEGALMVPDYQLTRVIYNGITNGFLVDGVSLFDLPLTRDNLATVFELVRRYTITKGDKEVKQLFNTRWKLVTGIALEETAFEIIKQERFVSSTSSTQGEKNFWFNRLDTDTFPQLENASYHPSADPLAWGLLPVKTQMSPYTIAYLNGKKKPTTQTVPLPADMLGFGVRGWWAVKVQERESQTVAWSFPSLNES